MSDLRWMAPRILSGEFTISVDAENKLGVVLFVKEADSGRLLQILSPESAADRLGIPEETIIEMAGVPLQ